MNKNQIVSTMVIVVTLPAFAVAGEWHIDYQEVETDLAPDGYVEPAGRVNPQDQRREPGATTRAGAGTPENPYEIATPAQLAEIRTNPSAHYVLVDNIDLAGFDNDSDPDNLGWLPIDDFSGSLDGQGYEITNLFIHRESSASDTGLFGSSDQAFVIRNLQLTNVSVFGDRRVGALVGEVDHEDAWIDNVTVTGTVEGEGRSVGGLVGYNAGLITESQAHVTVLMQSGGSVDGVGGLVGGNDEGEIRNSLATGDVTSHGRSAVGGLVGYNYWYGHIEDSHASGDVTMIDGSSGVGGLAGWNQENASIVNSKATGNVTANGASNVGGLIGEQGWAATLESASAAGAVTGGNRVGGLIGRLRDNTQVIHAQAHGNVSGETSTGGLIGSMSEALIHGRLQASGNVAGEDYVGGLIGRLRNFEEGINHDIDQAFAVGDVSGNDHVGGLIGGFMHESSSDIVDVTLSNIYAIGAVEATGVGAGGLVGTIEVIDGSMLRIRNAYAASDVNGTGNVAGLVGHNGGGEVTESYWDVETSGQAEGFSSNTGIFEAEGKETAAMQKQATFEGWNFASIWSIQEGNDYPRLFDIVFSDDFLSAP